MRRQKGRPPFPVERRPTSLVCACSTRPFSGSDREGRSVWLVAPWGHGSRCWAGLLRGTCVRCRGESTDQTSISVVTDEAPTFGWKLLEQGPESQAASEICWGGVSSVMAPPISMNTLSSGLGHSAISRPAHCLRGGIDRMWKWRACVAARGHGRGPARLPR